MSGHGSAGQDEKGEGKTEEPSAGLVSQQKSRIGGLSMSGTRIPREELVEVKTTLLHLQFGIPTTPLQTVEVLWECRG
jgi:hypothetical protein